MADLNDDDTPAPGAPIMPTGSGIADLEIAREQQAIADAAVEAETAVPVAEGPAADESAAHPS